jgi:hypothetical protein
MSFEGHFPDIPDLHDYKGSADREQKEQKEILGAQWTATSGYLFKVMVIIISLL